MSHLLAVILILGIEYAYTQDANCDYVRQVEPGQTYYVYSPGYSAYYTPGVQCRWIGIAPAGYNLRLDCTDINIPKTESCYFDRLLISKTGDSQLNNADYYCGVGKVTAVSTGQRISVGLITAKTSSGGKFLCQLYAQPATDSGTCSCGYKKQTRIVGGKETGVNAYPMMAGLADSRIAKIKCGAVIISNRYLLTAAHCLPNFDLSKAAVIVGEHDVTKGESPATRGYKIASALPHPSYSESNYAYDIAIITVTEDIVFSGLVGPVCLPFNYVNANLTGATLTILGWGTVFVGGPTSDVLREVDVQVISQAECRATVPSVTPEQICTYAPGKDACQDDSGGPLLITNPSTGLLYDIGIVSYGKLCASRGQPGVNTYVPALLDWIVANTPGANYCRK